MARTLPAYKAYLSCAGYSEYTPDDFTADVRLLSQFLVGKRLEDIETSDLQQWIGQLKQTMPPKTVSRKVSALGNYFRWLTAERVLARNPAEHIRAERVTSPLPRPLYDSECERLLTTASRDPRTYLLVLLVLESGLKKAELLELRMSDFDFSNQYQPEVWVRHSGRQVYKDRRLKLPPHIKPVFDDYVQRFGVSDVLFPYTPQWVAELLRGAARQAGIVKPVSASILRDMFVVRSVRRGMRLEDVLKKIGLSGNSSYDDALKKYIRLTGEAL